MLHSLAEGRNSGDPPGNAQPVIPSLLTSCYFCVSLLCRLKIKDRIWVEWIHLWKIISCQAGASNWFDVIITSTQVTCGEHLIRSGWPLSWPVLGYCSNGMESARMVEGSGSFDVGLVLLCTKNMYASSLSKHVCCDKVHLWVCVRWSVGLCMFLRSAGPTGLLRRSLKLPLASPWKPMKPVYYNYNHTIHTKEGRKVDYLRRQFGSELKEIQKITWKISKWYNYFHCGLPD